MILLISLAPLIRYIAIVSIKKHGKTNPNDYNELLSLIVASTLIIIPLTVLLETSTSPFLNESILLYKNQIDLCWISHL